MRTLDRSESVQLYRETVAELHARQEDLGQIAAMLSDIADAIAEDGPALSVALDELSGIADEEWITRDGLRTRVLEAIAAQAAVQRAWEALSQPERDALIGGGRQGVIRVLGA